MTTWDIAVETVRACLENGVREFVVCAGARNAALVEVLARAEAAGHVTLRQHFEERSAGFFAVGRCMQSEPCAVVTTSGTAVAELLPAVIEAHYQGRPLVLVTADRPARFRQSGAPQAIVQPGIFGGYAGAGEWADWDRRSPWHVNVELEEDFVMGEVEWPELAGPGEAQWPRLAASGLARWLKDDLFRGLVVMLGELEPEDREDVYHFVLDLKAPVVAEATSGLREALGPVVLADPDRALRHQLPGKVLRLGAVPSGRFWRDLEELPEVEVWSVTRSGWSGLARDSHVTLGEVGRVIRALGEAEEAGDALGLLDGNSRSAAEIEEWLEAYPDSEPGMLRSLSQYAALGNGVFLGNSLPIREWNRFAQWDQAIPEVRANRGANGIDGQISTWLGWSAAREDAWCVVGDLTALYDLAAPAMLGQVERKGRVLVVVNNGGGQIFSRVPRMAAMSDRGKELMVNPHELSLRGWAEMWGMGYCRIASQDDFDGLEAGEVPLLVELVPSAKETAAFWERLDG
ncbi:2-succinyl-5-enolpyruvyl-6-hydroxy-3-cyclohexene-1-carboxylate synthase [Haloferula luteola]|uniref:2-succinyl-5-enolpyruvyl-6-hydroxy-3-cyclohexene-1-carboxylate synthase n=1 Tax=Haloferula luteola TaxID=595692 RepID=A0A840V3J3_9BACT|nr:2-succinyl-5-enolpyruvyl-6-hydroxy-3-cyclohexene-1-carboxylate synthase [Haloferula luteola]